MLLYIPTQTEALLMKSLSLSSLINISADITSNNKAFENGEIKSVPHSDNRLALVRKGLQTLADGHDFPARVGYCDSRGEFMFSGNKGISHEACASFGAPLASLLSKISVRTGTAPMKSDVLPENGWVIINHFEAEKLIHLAASPTTKKANGAFNIPSINNHLEALAKHLGVNSDNCDELRQITQLTDEDAPRINGRQKHSFEYKNNTYSVISNNAKVKADIVISFNSSLWAVTKEA